jgi:ABC-type glycerol-3-phosphate transport system permease component
MKRKKKVIRSQSEKIVMWIVFFIFLIYAVTLVYPFVWMLINSLKTTFEFYQDVFSLPKTWNFSNWYDAVFTFKITAGAGEVAHEVSLFQMFLTSIFVTVMATSLDIFIAACTAYVLAYYNFKGKKLMLFIIIFSMIVPIVGTLPSLYLLIDNLGLMNNFIGVLLIYVSGLGFSFLLLYGHFKNLSWSYAEAAQIDGAGHFQTFIRIMIPLSKPVLISAFIVSSINYWNDYQTPAIFLQNYPTLAVGINDLTMMMKYNNNYPMMFATMLVAVVPIVVFFSIFQKTITENMVAGGLKG